MMESFQKCKFRPKPLHVFLKLLPRRGFPVVRTLEIVYNLANISGVKERSMCAKLLQRYDMCLNGLPPEWESSRGQDDR